MSADDAFLKRNWPEIKQAMQCLIAKDANGDGIIEGNQHNTLDTDWFGPVAWLSGMYLAALRAARRWPTRWATARSPTTCREHLSNGARRTSSSSCSTASTSSTGRTPTHLDAINSGTGCEIDQVFGQSWAFQVGLGRVLPEKETLSALQSLWRYNFTPDVGPYREANKPGRWYAMPGEAGLLMCTFPRSDWNYEQARGQGSRTGPPATSTSA